MTSAAQRLVRAIAVLLVTAIPSLSSAQFGINGLATRDCLDVGIPDPATTRPMLVGFHWATDARANDPDVLYCEEWWGPPQTGTLMAHTHLQSPGIWSIPPNWRLPQSMSSQHDVVVYDEDEIWIDSVDDPAGFDALAVNSQPVGAMSGGAPEVNTLANRHEIRWRALVEDNDELDANRCSLAGRGPRGFLVGYSIWALDAATHPSPTRRDFLVHGVQHVADLATLDFTVLDPTGAGASDLDSSDGLILINPDGLPDTGDEILELHVVPANGLAHWYAVQPIVKGRFDYFDGGTVCVASYPSAVVDISGDGVPDVADLMVDGKAEFSDNCLGLGLLWEGDIVTSPSPGLGGDLTAGSSSTPPECDRGLRSDQMLAVYEPSAVDRRNVDPLAVRRTADGLSLVLGWEETLGGEYVVYMGILERLLLDRRYEYWPVNPCNATPINQLELPRPADDVFFLVTQVDGTRESSYGRDSSGRERPPAHPCP